MNTTSIYVGPYGYGSGPETGVLMLSMITTGQALAIFPNRRPGHDQGLWRLASISFNTVYGRSCRLVVGPLLQNLKLSSNPDRETRPKCSVVGSAAPATFIAWSTKFPLTVTLPDPGDRSGAQPLGNTGICYTTDRSRPVPGSGTGQYLACGGKSVLKAPATVKAGACGELRTSQPAIRRLWVVKSAHHTSGVASQQRRPQ